MKDETLKLVLLQQNIQLGKEGKSGAGGPGLWCLPGSTASTQVGEGVFWAAPSVDCAFVFLHLPPSLKFTSIFGIFADIPLSPPLPPEILSVAFCVSTVNAE